MRTIFFYDKPFFLSSKGSLPAAANHDFPSLVTVENPDAASLESLVDRAAEGSVPGYLLITPDEEALFSTFQRIYHPVQAAGGIVTNSGGEVLLIFRLRRWDLPKGKIDPGETPEEAALREITEETGLIHISLEKKLTRTWHGYRMGTRNLLKETHWFKVSFTGNELTVPQIEEDIVDIQWIRPDNLPKYVAYSYPNLKSVFRAAGYPV